MNGVLALPTISVPPGATVKLSGWDLSSTIRISAADAACARPVNNATQAANRSALNLGIVQSPHAIHSCQTSGPENLCTGLYPRIYPRQISSLWLFCN